MGILQIAANWLNGIVGNNNATWRYRQGPKLSDKSERITVDHDLTYGLYHNSYPNFKLAGGLAYTPIAVPVWFMGVPSIRSENEQIQELGNSLVEQMYGACLSINTQCHRDGVVWVWPHYVAELGIIKWEFIPDDSVSAVIRSLVTGEIEQIIVDEQITITTGENQTGVVFRKRTFSKTVVTDIMTGARNQSVTYRNIYGIMPVPFVNNGDYGTVNGHSDYERIVYDLKSYHDIELMKTEVLSKFRPKMVQGTKDAASWRKNNGADSVDWDPAKIDFVLNVGDESTSFVFPQVGDIYQPAETNLFHKIVEESVIPEICWGLKTEGNHASAEEQMGMLVQYVKGKRRQAMDPYYKLFSYSLRLLGAANLMSGSTDDIKVTWDSLDELSAKTKAEVFESFADGLSVLMSSASITKQQVFNLWKELYPETTKENDIQEFIEGLSATGRLKQWGNANYLEAKDEDPDGEFTPQ